MTKLTDVNVVKLPRGQTAKEMLDDIVRLFNENIEGSDILEDCFLVYRKADGEMSYIGQSIKSCDPCSMIGILEVLKQIVMLELVQ